MLAAMTGASGSIGKTVVPKLLEDRNLRCRLLFRNSPANQKKIRRLKKEFGDRVEILFGDVSSPDTCETLVRDADFVLHLAAVIPPKSDHDEDLTWKTNYDGTRHIVDAIVKTGNKAALIYFSSVAVYGHRTEKCHWGRVGDPLLPSVFDAYGASKVKAERYILESPLKKFVILRESGVLYDNMMMNNIHDGLMFHTPINVFIEWISVQDTSRLLSAILHYEDQKEDQKPGFWNRIYNVGGGDACRQTGFDTYEDGFRLIGGSAKKFFEPRWHVQRNFHCFWFSDSDILEDLFSFRSLSCADFWKWFSDRHKIYRLGRIVPASLLKAILLKPLLKTSNAPPYWIDHDQEARIRAFYGSPEKYQAIPETWEETDLVCEQKDYPEMRICHPEDLLPHGFDETKPAEQLGLEDMKQAAAFRGGSVLSERMDTGDLRTKLTWQCHNGHIFESSPYTVLFAGHWCPDCCIPEKEWNFDELSKHIPFFAQAWYDSHEKDEDLVYYIDEHGAPAVRPADR